MLELSVQGEEGAFVAINFLDLFNSSEFVEAFFEGTGPLICRQSAEFKAEVGPVDRRLTDEGSDNDRLVNGCKLIAST